RETVEPPRIAVPELAPPPERVAREQRAREELQEAEQSLRTAREALDGEPQSSAARAEVDRYEREGADLRRRADYEHRKTEEGRGEGAGERAQQGAEAGAGEQARPRAGGEEQARGGAAPRAHQETRRKLAEQEAGRTLAEGLAKTRGGFMARLNAFIGASKE